MKIEKTTLDGVLSITYDVFEDHRGYYSEIYNRDIFKENDIKVDFIQDDISVSYKNVFRGIHGDRKTWKLISCLYGSFYLVVVNNIEGHEQYLKYQSFILSQKNRKQILVPPGFGNGHLVLSEKAIFHYKQNTNYDRSSQFTIKWNDSRINFWFPHTNFIISQRDEP